MHNKYYIIPLAVFLIGSLLMFDNLESAYAYTLTVYSVGQDVGNIVRLDTTGDDYLLTCNDGLNRVDVFNVNAPDTIIASVTITSFSGGCHMVENSGLVYVYGVGSNTLSEIDHTQAGTWFVVRTVSIGACSFGIDSLDTINARLYCNLTASDAYSEINLSTMTVVFTSANLAPTCDAPNDTAYNYIDDYVVLNCTTSGTVTTYTAGTSTNLHSISLTGVTDVSVASLHDRIFVTRGSTAEPNLYSYTPAGGFSLVVNGVTSAGAEDSIVYDAFGERFITNSGDELISGFDVGGTTSANTLLWQVSTVSVMSGSGEVFMQNADLSYVPYGTSTDALAVFDMTGLSYGTNAPPASSGSGGSGVDCTNPANAQILTCRLQSEGGSLNGTGGLVTDSIGNVICELGFIDCEANPDMRTNGVGYIFWLIGLMIMVGIFWVAGRGDISSIPTFVWFIGTIAITIAMTIMQFIDPTALVISIVVVIAFAVAKAKGVFGGGGSLMNESV